MLNNYRLSFKFLIYIVLFSLFLPFFYNLAMNRIFRKSAQHHPGDSGVRHMNIKFNDDEGGFSEKVDPHDRYHKSVKKELRSDKYTYDYHDFHDANGLNEIEAGNMHHSLPDSHLNAMHDRVSHLISDDTDENEKIMSADELSSYNGETNSRGLYIAILGDVYDVKKGAKHYGPGGSYNFFAGRDASNSFITGEFNKVTDDMDDVLLLEPRNILSLFQWKEFYDKEYKYKGKVIGRFYTVNGDETEYYAKVKAVRLEAIEERDREAKLEQKHPPCNIEWKADTGTKVWCTKLSGGIERDWTGVPRKYYQTAEHSFRCACIKDEHLDDQNLQEYENCEADSTVCYYQVE